MINAYDIKDSTEASSGRPLSDLRNFSRFGAYPFCGAAMAASLFQPGARRVRGCLGVESLSWISQGAAFVLKLDCGFLCCKLVKEVACRTGKTSF